MEKLAYRCEQEILFYVGEDQGSKIVANRDFKFTLGDEWDVGYQRGSYRYHVQLCMAVILINDEIPKWLEYEDMAQKRYAAREFFLHKCPLTSFHEWTDDELLLVLLKHLKEILCDKEHEFDLLTKIFSNNSVSSNLYNSIGFLFRNLETVWFGIFMLNVYSSHSLPISLMYFITNVLPFGVFRKMFTFKCAKYLVSRSIDEYFSWIEGNVYYFLHYPYDGSEGTHPYLSDIPDIGLHILDFVANQPTRIKRFLPELEKIDWWGQPCSWLFGFGNTDLQAISVGACVTFPSTLLHCERFNSIQRIFKDHPQILKPLNFNLYNVKNYKWRMKYYPMFLELLLIFRDLRLPTDLLINKFFPNYVLEVMYLDFLEKP